MQIRATGDVKKLTSTLEKAHVLMAVSNHEQTAAIIIERQLREDVCKLERPTEIPNASVSYYQRTGHIIRNCPQQFQGNNKGNALWGQSRLYQQ